MNYRFYKIGFFILLIVIIMMMILGPFSNRSGGQTNQDSSRTDTIDTMKYPLVLPEKRRRPPMPPADYR